MTQNRENRAACVLRSGIWAKNSDEKTSVALKPTVTDESMDSAVPDYARLSSNGIGGFTIKTSNNNSHADEMFDTALIHSITNSPGPQHHHRLPKPSLQPVVILNPTPRRSLIPRTVCSGAVRPHPNRMFLYLQPLRNPG